MAPIIQFTQNAVTPGPGIAMIGVPALVVTVDDTSTDVVVQRTFELLDVPLDAATLTGIFGGPGPAATASFTPDPAAANFGCYRVKVSTVNAAGTLQSSILDFATQTTQGWILPSFKAKAAELNFVGNVEGWEELLNRIFKWISLNWGTGSAGAEIQESVLVNEAILLGDPVIQSTVNDRVARGDAANPLKTGVVGVAKTAQPVIGLATTVVYAGKCTGVLVAATAGDAIYMANGGGLTNVAPATAVTIGYAINATDLLVTVGSGGGGGSGSGTAIASNVPVNEAIAIADPVYQSAVNNRVAKGDASVDAKAAIVGIAKTAQAVVGSSAMIVYDGLCTGILVGATAGTQYWLKIGGGITVTPPTTVATRMISMGYAVNATDLMVKIEDFGTLPS